jgi:hypothetical protein
VLHTVESTRRPSRRQLETKGKGRCPSRTCAALGIAPDGALHVAGIVRPWSDAAVAALAVFVTRLTQP